MNLELTLTGDKQLNRQILRTGKAIDNAAPAFEHIIDYLMGVERQQFQTEGGYRSSGWAPLLDDTAGHKILQESGALMRSLTEPGAAHQIHEVHPDWFIFGSDLDYAGYHQTGTGDLRGQDRRNGADQHGIPRRRPLELDENDRKAAVKRLQAWIMTGELLA